MVDLYVKKSKTRDLRLKFLNILCYTKENVSKVHLVDHQSITGVISLLFSVLSILTPLYMFQSLFSRLNLELRLE